MISLGANINGNNRLYETPLHVTAFKGHYKTIEILLKLGANTKCKDNERLNPLYYCLQPPLSKECLQLMLRYGATLSMSCLGIGHFILHGNMLECISEAVESRKKTYATVITFIGLKRFNKSNILKSNNIDVVKMIAEYIWDTRIDPTWQQTKNPISN
jgi:ankyrin repeat protein